MAARLIPKSEGVSIISLEKAITLIGRHPDCDGILPENQKISRRHCCIAQVENRLILRDLGSMNGVIVNGEQVSEIDLNDGDEITIGDEDFVLEIKTKGAAKSPVIPPKAGKGDAPTPSKPKPAPQRIQATNAPSGPQRRPYPIDISQEFPVPIPEDEASSEEEDLDGLIGANGTGRPTIPSPNAFLESPDRDFDDDYDILKLDSGEIELGDVDNLGKKNKKK